MGDLFPETLPSSKDRGADFSPPALRFFALYPETSELPTVVARQLQSCRDFAPGVIPRPPHMLHVSVALCGVPRRLRCPMEEALLRAQAAFSFPAFDVVLDSTACFGGGGAAFVAVADDRSTAWVNRLRRALADAQRPFGLVGERSATVPHLTLGYGEGPSDRRPAIAPIRFRVNAVHLVISTGHSEHRRLACWPLDA